MDNEFIDKYLRGEKIINKVTNCDFVGDTLSWSWEEFNKPLEFNILGVYPSTSIGDKLPKQVQFNDKKKATTLIYNKKAVVVKAREEDKYDRRIGFLEAYFQATSGMSKTKALKYLNDIVKDKATANNKEKTHLLKGDKK